MKRRARLGIVGIGLVLSLGQEALAQQGGIDEVKVKKAIADQMTPEELTAYKARLAAQLRINRVQSSLTGLVAPLAADTCTDATPEISTLPYGPVADTTVGQIDNYDLPPDTSAPTCTASTNCTGAPAGRGNIYTGTGTAPDRAYRIRTDVDCTLNITMDPTGAQDLALIVYQAACSNNLADCVCVDDTGVGGVAESVSLDAIAGTDYFIVIDGYSTGAAPPGPSGPFTLTVSETTATGCILTPVELQNFSVE